MRLLSRIIKPYQYSPNLPLYQVPEIELFPDAPEPPTENSAETEPQPGPQPAGKKEPAPSAEAERKSQEILDEAFRKAKQIVDSAQNYNARQQQEAADKIQRETEEAKHRGYEEGYSAGVEDGKKKGEEAGLRIGETEGRKKADAENRKYLDEISQMAESVEKSKSAILQKFESDLQDLAISIAESILKKELQIDEEAMRSIILNALDAYRNQEWVRIYVPEQTANVLLKADRNIAEALKNVSENVKVVVTSNMKEGDCVLEMPDQVIEAGVSSQLRKIKSAIEMAVDSEDDND